MELNQIVTVNHLSEFKERLMEDLKQLLKKDEIKKQWLKSSDARKLMGGISAAKLQSLRIGGHIPASNIDGMWLYKYEDIMDFLESNKTNRKEDL